MVSPIWNRHVGSVWLENFMQLQLDMEKPVIEVAPGSVNKVGLGMAFYGFRGDVYLVEPCPPALDEIAEKYRQCCWNVFPVNRTLESGLKFLPTNPEAILSNHPLDDMIISKALSDEEIRNLFTDHYEAPVEKTRIVWDGLMSKPAELEKAKEAVVGEWVNAIDTLNPRLVVISQYHSCFFKRNGLEAPDREAYDVLSRLKDRFADKHVPLKSEYIEDKSRWLALRF